MLILDKIKALFRKSGNFDDLLRGYWGAETSSGEYVSPQTAMRCSAVYACVGILSESIAQLPVKVYHKAGRERIEDKTHPLYKLLAVKPSLTAFKFSLGET